MPEHASPSSARPVTFIELNVSMNFRMCPAPGESWIALFPSHLHSPGPIPNRLSSHNAFIASCVTISDLHEKAKMTGSDRLSKTDFSGKAGETQFEEEKNWEGQLLSLDPRSYSRPRSH